MKPLVPCASVQQDFVKLNMAHSSEDFEQGASLFGFRVAGCHDRLATCSTRLTPGGFKLSLQIERGLLTALIRIHNKMLKRMLRPPKALRSVFATRARWFPANAAARSDRPAQCGSSPW